MIREITTINLWENHFLLRGSGGVNCYLVRTDTGYVLIDSGLHARRGDLVRELESAGCRPGNLSLIIVTHGDLDHIGNCAYLRDRYGAQIAAHPSEFEAVESGNMTLNRKTRQGVVARTFLSLVSLFTKSDRLKPDLPVEEGCDLASHGFNAQVLHLPGHSLGSIGILTAGDDPETGSTPALFCGDMLLNVSSPEPQPNQDAPAALKASLARVASLPIKTVYPGHGKPFLMSSR
jgi:glyoxylase-like metal-dependent hydrolase (beta-lactamase superfamily II)